MTSAARLVLKNATDFKRQLDKEDRERLYAANLAVRVEGFRLKKELQDEIKAGAPGGKKFAPLREISKRVGRGTQKRNPLQRLSIAVKANFTYGLDKVINKFQIGFVGAGAYPISNSWKRIAKLQQEGGTAKMSDIARKTVINIGGRYKSKSKAKYFFLKKTTQTFEIPKRPIIDPFWSAHNREASVNIVRNFERKMAGQRI